MLQPPNEVSDGDLRRVIDRGREGETAAPGRLLDDRLLAMFYVLDTIHIRSEERDEDWVGITCAPVA